MDFTILHALAIFLGRCWNGWMGEGKSKVVRVFGRPTLANGSSGIIFLWQPDGANSLFL